MCIFIPLMAMGEDLWFTQAGAGAADGSSLANAFSAASFNNSANWGSGAGKVSAGDTARLSGTFTSALTVQDTGTAGNIITINFETGAKLSTTTWGASGSALTITSKRYITIEGNSGIIEETANGTGLANQHDNQGITLTTCGDVIVRNLIITNIFRRTAGDSDSTGRGNCIQVNSCTNTTISGCDLSHAAVCLYFTYGVTSNLRNFAAFNNNLTRCNWGFGGGDTADGAQADGVYFTNNIVQNYREWDNPTGNFHHNCVFPFASQGSSSRLLNMVVANNQFGPEVNNDGFATSYLFFEGYLSAPLVFNNLFTNSASSTAPAQAYFYDKPVSAFSRSTKFFNNTIVGRSQQGTALDLEEDGAQVTNNLILSVSSAIYNAGSTPSALSQTYDYNVYAGCLNNFGDLGRTFAAWQALTSTPDVHSSTSTPTLDAGWAPTAADTVCKDAGTASVSAAVVIDKAGVARPQGSAYDIGAFEYQTPAAPPAFTARTGRLKGVKLRP